MDSGLLAISPQTLRPNVPLGVNVYVRLPGEPQPILLLAANESASAESLNRLLALDDVRCYVPASARDAYQSYLRQHLNDWLIQDAMPTRVKAATLGEVVRGVLEEGFAAGNTETMLPAVDQCAHHISQLLTESEIGVGELSKILHHDFGTFTHSTNVAFYAAAIARRVGFSPDDLHELSVGCLLHDVGKLDIRESVLNKPGKLDDAEFREIKTHPIRGYQRLCHLPEITQRQLLITYQHHERLDGRGYPVGLPGHLIHDWSKLASVADVYEALTSFRPYRQPMPRSRAIELMQRDRGSAFDPEFLECLTSLMPVASTS